MIEGDTQDSTLSSTSQTVQQKNGVQYTPLDIVENRPLLIDNKQIYYKGFLSLSEEDKARVLLGFLVTQDHISLNNLDDLNPTSIQQKHELTKDTKMFKLKFYGIVAVVGLIIVAAIVFIAMFAYTSLDKGVLDENGTTSGILSTLQEVLRILFTDPTSSSPSIL